MNVLVGTAILMLSLGVIIGVSAAVQPLGLSYEYLELVFGLVGVTVIAIVAALLTSLRLRALGLLIYAGIAIGLAFEGITACSVRGKCEDWGLAIIVFAVFAAAPVAAGLVLGRKAGQFLRWQRT